TDCDGLSDTEEFARTWGPQGKKTDPNLADTDGDGIPDGIEAGATASVDSACTAFTGDLDPTRTTSPVEADTDGDGLTDGIEDRNRNGRFEPGETDPTIVDTDGDGLPDGLEDRNGNGEVNAGETDPRNPDSDADWLTDGTEDRNRDGVRQPTETDPLKADTDGDGCKDGDEDRNGNGVVDTGESDPLVPDCESLDSDGDGIPDTVERTLGTNPLSADSDCDGLLDGEERTVFRTDPLKADSDGDGLVDGLEAGRTSSPGPGCNFRADADPATRTFPHVADSDSDGVPDGVEDKDKNGRVDSGETDPLNPDTDGDLLLDGIEDRNRNGTVDLGETNPLQRDTDGDKLSDGTEDRNRNGQREGNETDPLKPDTDGDGCLDGDEDVNGNGLVDPGETNPLVHDCPRAAVKDSDCDGLSDAAEDANGNGTVDPGETNPNNPDSDGDGLKDGLERGATVNPNPITCPSFVADLDPLRNSNPLMVDTDCDGLKDGEEDLNANGRVDLGETDPNNPDSDGDGLADGLEKGSCAAAYPGCQGRFVPDGDCGATTTDPTKADTDGDGILDGAEDVNGNGVVDAGEFDPRDGTDAVGPVQKACVSPRVIVSREIFDSDLQLATTGDFSEVTTLVAGGRQVGVMLYDANRQIAAFALHQAPAPANVSALEADGLAKLNALGAVTSNITQTFTSWDGFDALQATYEQSGAGVDLKKRVNDLVLRYFPGATGTLAGNAGATGDFRIRAEYLRRSANRAMVVMAFIPTDRVATADNLFRIDDLGNGTALAQFGDAHRPICEKFQSAPFPKVDFLWIVDNSCSMDDDQAALAAAVSAMEAQLQVAPIDWRVGTAYTDTDRPWATNKSLGSPTPYVTSNQFRPFTRDLNQFRIDATPCRRPSTTPGGPDTYSCSSLGSGTEKGFEPLRWLLETDTTVSRRILPATASETPGKLRQGAKLVVVWVTDARELSGAHPAGYTSWIDYLQRLPGNVGTPFVGGIVCPLGQTCPGEEQILVESPLYPQGRYRSAIAALNGVEVDLRNLNAIEQGIEAIVRASIGSATTTRLQKPPISASLKVAIAGPTVTARGPGCNRDDVPRGRTHGFDFDGASKSLVFYGDCRPDPAVPQTIAASYRYWVDLTANPNGNPPPCGGPCPSPTICDPVSNQCVCPGNCGGCGNDRACDVSSCTCVCPADCGGRCTGNFLCDTASCGCVCTQQVSCAPGFKFDATRCQCVCDTQALNCGPGLTGDPASCTCQCASDCGGGCGTNQKCDTASCACVCDTSKVTCPAGQVPDAKTCACVCAPDCGGCAPGFTCDTSSCACRCNPSTQCAPGFKLDPATCRCVCDTGQLNCGPTHQVDPASCSCACKPDCGGC
ncbi:MAG: adventurous gliding motility lipoprotein CglD, partial [Myxococcales bacterium]